MFYIDIGNEMKIYDLIETCHLEQNHLDNNLINQVIESYPSSKWISVTKQFLKGLDKNHTMIGNEIFTLVGIINFYEENLFITEKQQWYVTWSLIRNWHQLDIEFYNYYML